MTKDRALEEALALAHEMRQEHPGNAEHWTGVINWLEKIREDAKHAVED